MLLKSNVQYLVKVGPEYFLGNWDKNLKVFVAIGHSTKIYIDYKTIDKFIELENIDFKNKAKVVGYEIEI